MVGEGFVVYSARAVVGNLRTAEPDLLKELGIVEEDKREKATRAFAMLVNGQLS